MMDFKTSMDFFMPTIPTGPTDPPTAAVDLIGAIDAVFPRQRWENMSVAVAVSGGADSVALLHALATRGTGARIVVAHFHHGLRGVDADMDAQFVIGLAEGLGLVVSIGHWRRATEPPGRVESAARTARYAFLQDVAAQYGARYLATGHTADDQAETILHRILRGTGLQGLAGIPQYRRLNEALTVVRPLLHVTRAGVLAYLHEHGIPFREDATNRDPVFTRNRLRHQLLPELERSYNRGVRRALLRLGEQAADTQRAIRQYAHQWLEASVVEWSECEIIIDCRPRPPRELSRAILRQALVEIWRKAGWPEGRMGFDHWELLADLTLSETDRQMAGPLPGGIVAAWHQGHVRLRKV